MKFEYEVINVVPDQKLMMVKYIDEHKNEVIVGTRIPYEDESLDAFLKNHCPKPKKENKTLKTIEVGLKGSVDIIDQDKIVLSDDELEKIRIEQIQSIVKEMLDEYKLI
jgi:hypothetical protein